MDENLARMIAYARALRYEDLPHSVVERAKRFVLDTVGCALGAAFSEPAETVLGAAANVTSRTPATVMVGGWKTSPDMAAFANGVMARYLDWNDTYTSKGTCHPSDMLAPTLAAVQMSGGGGQDVILGMVLGYEVHCGLADAGGLDAAIGPHQTFDGAIAAAVTAGRLAGLDPEQMQHAIALTASACRPLGRARFAQLSHWKESHVANGSRNALFFVNMAARGLTGPDVYFERPTSLTPFGGRGSDYRILRSRMKRFPAGYYAQSAIEAAQKLHSRIKDRAGIKAVRISTFPANTMGFDASRWSPATRETADHSLPFVVAMGLLEGGLELRHLEEQRFLDPDVRAFMAKISIQVSDECAKPWPEAAMNIIDVEMHAGETLSARCAYHSGHYLRLMTDKDLEGKFRSMAEGHVGLPREQVDRLLDALWDLEGIKDIGAVLELTTVPARHP